MITKDISVGQMALELSEIKSKSVGNQRSEVYATCLASLDLTTLSVCDNESSVREFVRRALSLYQAYPHIKNVASICVYPAFVECVGLEIDGTPMRITSVAAGFPASQTFMEVKALEVAMAIESGADEVDVVISVGEILEGEYDQARSELELLRAEAGVDEGERTILKVILETGELKNGQQIYDAAMVAMHAGADFIKSSTGKTAISATPEAISLMCHAAKDYYEESGRRVGIKVAGGVRSAEDAALYYTIVEHILGAEWLTPSLFRIGASSAANALLSAITGHDERLF